MVLILRHEPELLAWIGVNGESKLLVHIVAANSEYEEHIFLVSINVGINKCF